MKYISMKIRKSDQFLRGFFFADSAKYNPYETLQMSHPQKLILMKHL